VGICDTLYGRIISLIAYCTVKTLLFFSLSCLQISILIYSIQRGYIIYIYNPTMQALQRLKCNILMGLEYVLSFLGDDGNPLRDNTNSSL
jgi:uncharacterized membrane protein